MAIHRLSAVEIFGVPFDTNKELAGTPEDYMQLMGQYGITPQLVEPVPLTDITPNYFQEPELLRRWLLRSESAGEAIIDIMPLQSGQDIPFLTSTRDLLVFGFTDKTTYRLPQQQRAMAMLGRSPRFIGKECVHELFINL